jgi:hypothetical protein
LPSKTPWSPDYALVISKHDVELGDDALVIEGPRPRGGTASTVPPAP